MNHRYKVGMKGILWDGDKAEITKIGPDYIVVSYWHINKLVLNLNIPLPQQGMTFPTAKLTVIIARNKYV